MIARILFFWQNIFKDICIFNFKKGLLKMGTDHFNAGYDQARSDFEAFLKEVKNTHKCINCQNRYLLNTGFCIELETYRIYDDFYCKDFKEIERD